MTARRRRGALVAGCAVLAAACSHGGHSSSRPPPTTVAPATTTTTGPPPGNTASAPGVTAGRVVIATHGPLTGPDGRDEADIAAAERAYIAFVNDHGGVHGRMIDLKVIDDQGNPSSAVDATRDLVAGGLFAMIDGRGLSTHRAVSAVQAGTPDLFIGTPCTCWQTSTNPLHTGFAPSDVVEGSVQGDFVARSLPGKRVGYLVPSDMSGADAVDGLDRRVPAAAVVSRQTYDPVTGSVKAQVLALVQARAEVVVLYSTPPVTAAALIAAADAGYHPTWVVSNSGSDVTAVTSAIQATGRAGGSLTEGMLTDAFLVPADDATDPWTQQWRKIRDTYAPTLRFDGYVTYGMAVADTFARALDKAGQNPTRTSLMQALAAVDPAVPGLSVPAFGPPTRTGYDAVEMGAIAVGQFVPAGPPMTLTATGAVAPAPPAPVVHTVPAVSGGT